MANTYVRSPVSEKEKARTIYGIGPNSKEFNYLDVTNDGFLTITLNGKKILFQEIVEKVKDLELGSVVVRIPDLVKMQLDKLYDAFNSAIKEYNYQNRYQGVYPIKVNQTAPIIDAIAKFGQEHNHGWEAGTKPELMIAVSRIQNPGSTLIICNGTKDSEYVEACMLLKHHGHNIIVSVESLHELNLVLECAQKYEISPSIGLRIKINQKVPGHWGHSSGIFSKFGLNAHELKKAISLLKQTNMLDSLKMLHGHIGSQINDSKYFKRSAQELFGLYAMLINAGASSLQYLNFGGGLGIDYEGNANASDSGTKYSFNDYAKAIVSTLAKGLENIEDIPTPTIITESGRAITAHSSITMIQILEQRAVLPQRDEINFSTKKLNKLWNDVQSTIFGLSTPDEIEHLISKIINTLQNFEYTNEFIYNYQAREEVEIFYAEMRKLVRWIFKENKILPTKNTLEKLPLISDILAKADTHLVGNFSVFNSACDAVLASQYFPIFPTKGFLDKPTSLYKIIDVTCDSDGELCQFKTKKYHSAKNWKTDDFFTTDGHILMTPDEPAMLNGIPLPESACQSFDYLLIGLTGAYQDTVSFDQNLLGHLAEVSLEINERTKELEFQVIRYSESNMDLLPKMQHNIKSITKKLPLNIFFEELLYSSPYILEKIRFDSIINNEDAESIIPAVSQLIKQTLREKQKILKET